MSVCVDRCTRMKCRMHFASHCFTLLHGGHRGWHPHCLRADCVPCRFAGGYPRMRIDAQPLGIRLVGAMKRCRVGPRAYSPPHDYRYESGHAPVRPLDTAPVNPQTEVG